MKIVFSTTMTNPTPNNRIVPIELPEKTISFKEWKEVIINKFPELVVPAEIIMSIVTQTLVNDITNPFALVLVGAAANGKTICLNFFQQIKGLTEVIDNFTPAAFLSHAANRKKAELEENDLLPLLRYKTALLRDLATLFAKREEDLTSSLGILTRVLDGEGLSTASGSHGLRQLVGEYLFMLVAASTPIRSRVWKIMAMLGSRIFFLQVNAKEKTDDELAEQNKSISYKPKEKECRLATQLRLYTLWATNPNGIDWDKANDDKTHLVIIARCARLIAKLRSVIDEEEKTIEPENPSRVNQLLYNLARGHAVAQERKNITENDLKQVIILAFDNAPYKRSKLFKALIKQGGVIATSQVMEALKCVQEAAIGEMNDLVKLGICKQWENPSKDVGRPEKQIHLAEPWQWFISDECKSILATD